MVAIAASTFGTKLPAALLKYQLESEGRFTFLSAYSAV
jgi:hypothetical protein